MIIVSLHSNKTLAKKVTLHSLNGLKVCSKEGISCHPNPGKNLMAGEVIGIRVVAGIAIL